MSRRGSKRVAMRWAWWVRPAVAALLALALSGAPALARPPLATGHRCTCGMQGSGRRCTCPHCRGARPASVPCLRSCGGLDDSARPELHGDPAVLAEAIASPLPPTVERFAGARERPETHHPCPELPPPRRP